ncbi:hypothetical protein CR513_04657, partial [Mucuna pruriens]
MKREGTRHHQVRRDPNVPLLGTQGTINYNPELTVRQAGYPIITPPPEEALTPFVLPGSEAASLEQSPASRIKHSTIRGREGHWKRKLEEALEENHQEKHLNVEITKKARAEHDARLRIGSCLNAADKEMCARRVERDQVAIEKERLEKTLLGFQRREDEQRE